MSLRRLRNWLNIASTGALAMVRSDVDGLSGRVDRIADQIDAINARHTDAQARHQQESEALRGEIHTLRGEADFLRGALQLLGERFDAHAAQAYAGADDLSVLRVQVEGDEQQAEALRLKLAAVAEQLRWESEDLRKGLAAIAERTERERKAG